MLVEFRVKNFRSFKEEQVLSLVATKDKTLENNRIPSCKKEAPFLLRSAVIYGANASGKSNIIKAIDCMRQIVTTLLPPNGFFNIKPFLLHQESPLLPIAFKVTFILDKVRYQYCFSFVKERIVSECLLVYKTARPQKWFERKFNEKTEQYDYKLSPFLKGKKETWKESTRPNTLFLSVSAQLNSEQILPIVKWFQEKLIIFNAPISPGYSINILKSENEQKQKVCDLITFADTGITNIQIIKRHVPAQTLQVNVQEQKTELRTGLQEINEPQFIHKTHHCQEIFNVSDESQGTLQLLSLAGPILDILEKGHILVVDEFDIHLHPLLLQKLVEMFHDPRKNRNNAQLIFVTHDTSLLAADLFRRDQIWFVEKDPQTQESTLYPLSDFEHRKDERLDRSYLLGCYGAIPFF